MYIENIAENLVKYCREKKIFIASAESITGGKIANEIINIPGSSEIYYEGIVSYSNESKINRLNVKEKTIKQFGAVSKETAIEMVKGLLNNKVQYAVSTTGIAGPTGDSRTKKIGLTYIAYGKNSKIECLEYNFEGNRNDIRDKATFEALSKLYNFILNDDKTGE